MLTILVEILMLPTIHPTVHSTFLWQESLSGLGRSRVVGISLPLPSHPPLLTRISLQWCCNERWMKGDNFKNSRLSSSLASNIRISSMYSWKIHQERMYYATTYIWKAGVPSYQHVWLPDMKITTPQVWRLFTGFKTSPNITPHTDQLSSKPNITDLLQMFQGLSYFILASNINQHKEKDKLLIILAQISCDATWLRRSTSKDKSRRLAPAFNRKGYRPQGKPQAAVSSFFWATKLH